MHRVPSVVFPLYKDYRLALPGYKHFEEKLKGFKPDLLHINSPCSLGYGAVKYGQKSGIPVVATYHTHFPSYARYYNVKAVEAFSWNYFRKVYNGCNRVYVPSLPILRELKQHELKNLEFIPHGVDTSLFHPRFRSSEWRRRLGINDKIILLYVGRLVWEKDLRTLAEAYRLLVHERQNLAFVLVGEGPILSELRSLMPDAHFVGYQSGEALSIAYASSDLFVFPSTTETFGNVTIEAMASRVAPICAGDGGSGGLVQDGVTGLLTRGRDAADLAAKIHQVASSRALRDTLAHQAFTYAQTQSWDHIFDKLLESYGRVVDEHVLRLLLAKREAA
jgi:glycosyltransferase involved in cell wall biosynthesis